jgi:hypothetical protein
MSRGALIPSAVDLTDAGNVVQARHELHRAVDHGGETEQAAWSRKWGEAALAAGEKASRDAGGWDGWSLPRPVEDADEANTSLMTELAKTAPDIEKCRRLAGRISKRLDALKGAFEE